ncbi:MAG: hypothetical protein B6I26_08005 [Desulfobacteraceae bacterium 4572_130]|nr:MAG: hypothetical protein B6I26_08005 [Desulfobacteraceae bacterium 4572_130]
MSTLVKNKIIAVYENGHIIISMEKGVEIKFPISKNKQLINGTNQQLNNIEISPYGLHWPDLDEDLSFQGLLKGDYGQYVGMQRSHHSEYIAP